jgi:HAE1 family hydrophobic/amphiphilic exporter-1
MYLLGYTINVLTMFGLILVIGSLVDDAIVVVENTQALMEREGLSAKEAAAKSMTQITGAIIATTLVTLACYLPLVFYGGMVGMMYVQFAVTMCVALCLSTVVALILSPVLCAYVLKVPESGRRRLLLAPFNRTVDLSRRGYLTFVTFFSRRAFLTLLCFAGCLVALWLTAGKVPTAFLPKEDRGYIGMNIRLSEGQSMDRTIAIVDEVHARAAKIEGLASTSSTCGRSSTWGTGENQAVVWFRLEHWDKRQAPHLSIDRIMDRLKAAVSDLYAGEFVFTQPAAIRGLGGSSGVGFNFCAISGQTEHELHTAVTEFVHALSTNKMVKSAYHGFESISPQLDFKLDRRKAQSLGLTPKAIFQTLQNKLASYYVNDFNILGGVYEVKLQNDPEFRSGIDDVRNLQIPIDGDSSVPITALGRLEYVTKARETMSYNKMLAAWCEVNPNAGYTSSEIMSLIESTPRPEGYVIEWGPIQLQER